MATHDSVHFYRNLPALSSFAEATEARRYADVPGDWWVVIADVAGSTRAIQAGAYKNVNTVGVACIAAVVNVDRGIDRPFVFTPLKQRLAEVMRRPESADRLLCDMPLSINAKSTAWFGP